MSGIINKVKDALHSDHSHSTTSTGAAEGVAGPHSSRLANAADPRVDSDLDGSRKLGAATNTAGDPYTTTSTGVHGTRVHDTGVTGTGVTGTGVHTGVGGYSHSTNAGPHNSNLANKLDPRVDSDLNGSRTLGATTGTTGVAGAPVTTSTTGATHTTGVTGHHAVGTGYGGRLSNSTNDGPHNSNLANKLDPRVDSDLDGRGNRHIATGGSVLGGASGSHATPGSGTAQNTAGPHNSDILNKLDPRVDSDLDGSATLGGNQTRR